MKTAVLFAALAAVAFSAVVQMPAHKIASLVTKDGGAAGGFPEKLEAAGRCGAAVFVVRRPRDEGLSYDEVLEIIRRKRA